MKVLQILPALEVGGVERGVIDLSRAMQAQGDQVVVISSGGRLVADLVKLGVAHYELPVHKKSLWSLSLVSKIARIIEHERVDVIHARSRVPAWLAWLASRKTQVPLVTTCHGYYSTHLLSRVMGWGKRVIVISRIVGRHMIDDFGVSPERIRLIHRGLDLKQFPYHPKKYDQPPGKLKIVNVGRLTPIKGQLEFLKAIHLLRRELQMIEVSLVGAEGKGKHKYTDRLKQAIQQMGLESCVHLLGTRRDVPELIAGADLLVLSTLVPEAFGRVVIEAGASGTAVLSTRVGGVLDILDDGHNGALVPPGNSEAMARRMAELLRDRPMCGLYATRLHEKVEECFTLEEMTRKTVEVYREVKDEKKILVIKLGAMGDVILSVPSLRMLRARFPKAKITVMVDKRLAALLSSCSYVDEVIPVNRKKFQKFFYLLKLSKCLRGEGYDISLDLQNSKWTHLLGMMAGIPFRTGYRRGKLGFLLNRGLRPVQKPEPPVQNQFRLLSKIGVSQLDDELELWNAPAAEKKVSRFLEDQGVVPEQDLVAMVIGSSPKWKTKRWPARKFSALADRLAAEKKCRVILIGAASDQETARQVLAEASSPILDATGWTTTEDLVPLIRRCQVMVTGDTAPLHVAAAVQTPIVALFGPTDPKRHMPPAKKSILLHRRLECQPCYKGDCQHSETLACLEQIPVHEVFEAVVRQLGLRTNDPQPGIGV